MVVIDIAHVLQSRNIRETSWMLWGLVLYMIPFPCEPWYTEMQFLWYLPPSAATYQPMRWYSSIRMSTGQCLVWPTTFPAASSVQNSYCLMIVDIVDCIIMYYHHNYHNYINILCLYWHRPWSVISKTRISWLYIYILSSLSSSNWESPISVDDF